MTSFDNPAFLDVLNLPKAQGQAKTGRVCTTVPGTWKSCMSYQELDVQKRYFPRL